jgi:hypothetical protein
VVTVEYQHRFNYRQFRSGSSPVLQVRITRQDIPGLGFDADAYLDSGAEASLFNGDLLAALEIDLLNNNQKSYGSTFGGSVTGYLHNIRLTLPDVGDFSMEIGFSHGEIRRNLLGRDFFNLVQIGFRERHLEYYLNPLP